jgi:predicted restriction endonuclease
MIDKYLQVFATLRTDRGGDRYPEITYHRAPHKPFLLLSIMDLIAQGRITENLIDPPHEPVSLRDVDYFITFSGEGRVNGGIQV